LTPLAESACFVVPLTLTPLFLAPLECVEWFLTCIACDLIVVERLRAFAGLLDLWDVRSLARRWAARTRALTKSSLRMECQPDRPLLLAISARSFQLCVFKEVVVIKGR